MAALLKVIDEHFGATAKNRRPAVELRLVSERTSAREIIRRRVEAEVADLNARRDSQSLPTRSWLVSAEDGSAEALLNANPSVVHRPRQLDAANEADRAIKAFRKNRFILLFNDRQLEHLDDEVGVTDDAEVVFLFLTPLKGG